MSEIDLIPVDYRFWLGQQALLRKYIAAFVAFSIFVIGTGIALGQSAKRAQVTVMQLKSASAITQQQQTQLQQLKDQQAEYERR